MKAEHFDITKRLIPNVTGNRQTPLPDMNMKLAFVAKRELLAALQPSETDAALLNKNKN
jgi:hypothetical protein